MKNLVEYVLLSVFRFILLLFPLPVVQKLGKAFGSFVFYCIPIRKTLVLNNLHHAFPEKSEEEIKKIALQNFQSIFTTFFETFWFSRLTEKHIRAIVKIHGISKIDELLSRGNGLILLSGHLSNWELMAIAVGLMSNLSLRVIIKKQHNPFVDRMMNSLRTKFNNVVVDMDRAPREIIKCLRENSAVAMLADQSGPEEGVFVNFFGRPASTHVGPAVFSLRTGAPILIASAVRSNDGTFTIEFEEVATDALQGTDDEKIKAITERHVQLLEKYVRRCPSQWLWMHKRWKHTEKYLRTQMEHAGQ